MFAAHDDGCTDIHKDATLLAKPQTMFAAGDYMYKY